MAKSTKKKKEKKRRVSRKLTNPNSVGQARSNASNTPTNKTSMAHYVHQLISNWEDMNRIEPNRTITANQFNTKADFESSEISLAIAITLDEN